MQNIALVANWKMHGCLASLDNLKIMSQTLAHHPLPLGVRVIYCLPSLLLPRAVDLYLPHIQVGGQDCHTHASGAFTGDTSAVMLAEAGATHVILGHSERRTAHGESCSVVRAKVSSAHANGLTAIVCVGETETQRDAGQITDLITQQLTNSLPDTVTPHNTILAYEPLWAIGTGKTPSPDDIHDVHTHINAQLQDRFQQTFTVLYGGSVKPSNASQIASIDSVGGVLVGGASLLYADFWPLVQAFTDQKK